ncbi:MAG: GIY-YIG nuclease family protein [Caulobacteraceae bacterium]
MDRDSILAAVRETAATNGGAALGRLRLESEAGVKEHHWKKYWARYGDLVREAGFEPQSFKDSAKSESELSAAVVKVARELGRFPTRADLRVKRTYDDSFPSVGVFERVGGKAEIVAMVARYCEEQGIDDVAALCAEVVPKEQSRAPRSAAPADGYVYLLKSGRFHKIGRSVHAGARERQLAIQLPEPANLVHTIRTDDPAGIESYWHQRFAAKRRNGEWFDLSREDVAAFRRRKFM